MTDYIDFAVLGKVLLAAVLGGVGLAAMFALGLRGVSRVEEGHVATGASVALVSFSVVAAGVVFGIYTLLAA